MEENKYIETRNLKIAQKTVNSLNKRYFEAFLTHTKEEALKKAAKLINKKDVIAWGGSMSVVQSGLIDYLLNNNYNVINRDSAKTQEERTELLRKSLLCDTYLMGTNALSEDGQLVNIDCTGNRTAALIYGPKQVIIIVSVKKIMPSLEDAITRARNYAAPVNMQRISQIMGDKKTPCMLTGSCANCTSEDSICANIVITRLCVPKGRIKVILTLDDIGF